MHGALRESEHVFIQAGLERMLEKPVVRIFEVGFGTGLNAWLTYKRVKELDTQIIYHSVEPFPLPEEIVEKLNYIQQEEDQSLKDFFLTLHRTPWNEEAALHKNFTFKKIEQRLEDYEAPKDFFDIIYYDAFAPSKQAEMWLPENIEKVHTSLTQGGILVTYCARGQFKRDLKAQGFTVETLLGPPGKKEMTRGTK